MAGRATVRPALKKRPAESRERAVTLAREESVHGEIARAADFRVLYGVRLAEVGVVSSIGSVGDGGRPARPTPT